MKGLYRLLVPPGERPARKDRESLRVGDRARLLFQSKQEETELLWVQVTAVGKREYEARVFDNPETSLSGTLAWGDLLTFKPIHIDKIHKETE